MPSCAAQPAKSSSPRKLKALPPVPCAESISGKPAARHRRVRERRGRSARARAAPQSLGSISAPLRHRGTRRGMPPAPIASRPRLRGRARARSAILEVRRAVVALQIAMSRGVACGRDGARLRPARADEQPRRLVPVRREAASSMRLGDGVPDAGCGRRRWRRLSRGTPIAVERGEGARVQRARGLLDWSTRGWCS